MNPKDIKTASAILSLLIEYGIPAGVALTRAIKALWGHDLTEADIQQRLDELSANATIRATLAEADARGGV